MKSKAFAVVLVAALCSFSLAAQPIPAGDDVWDSLGGGATDLTLSSADWYALCGASVADTAVQLKGWNLPGQGTGDTIVTRLKDATFTSSSTAVVDIKLKDLSMVSDGSHPCSPLTLRVTEDSSQSTGSMTIVRTSSAGGTFRAKVLVNAVVEAVDGSGNVVGTTYVGGSLEDEADIPWSYQPASSFAAARTAGTGAAAVAKAPWHPAVHPVTHQPVRVCRRGNKILPARHCYQPAPACPSTPSNPSALRAAAVDQQLPTPKPVPAPVEPCLIDSTPTTPTTPRN